MLRSPASTTSHASFVVSDGGFHTHENVARRGAPTNPPHRSKDAGKLETVCCTKRFVIDLAPLD